MAKHLERTWLLAAALLPAGLACADDLPDPTRPPMELAAPGIVAAGPVLQSVQISPQGRFAIISGQRVKLGDAYGEARVVKISEGEVALKSGGELQTLRLFPGVEKRMTHKDRKTKR